MELHITRVIGDPMLDEDIKKHNYAVSTILDALESTTLPLGIQLSVLENVMSVFMYKHVNNPLNAFQDVASQIRYAIREMQKLNNEE